MENQEYRTSIEGQNGLKLEVLTCAKYWAGHDSGKMEDMPGNFLDTKITLTCASKNASLLERLAAEKKVVLSSDKKEITNEPEGYAKMWHEHKVKKVKENPEQYLLNLQNKVKNAL